MSDINILSPVGFIFFLLIILLGYIFVEIIFGENYFYRSIFKKYNNNLFDRLVHYISWGFIINIITFFSFLYVDGIEYFKIIDISGSFVNTLQNIIGRENILTVQIILISMYQFILILLIYINILIIKYIVKWVEELYNLIFNKNKISIKSKLYKKLKFLKKEIKK